MKGGIMDTLSKGIICDRSCETDHSTIEALKSTVKELQSLDKHLVEKQIANIEKIIDFISPMVNLIVIICPSCCNIQYLHSGNGRGATKGYCDECLRKYPGIA